MDAVEAELVERLRRRDPAALEELYARHHERVYRFLLRMSGRQEIAEDLCQETWLAVARDAPRLEIAELVPWIFAVARNRYRSYRRWAILDLTRLLTFAAEALRTAPSPEGEAGARIEAAAARAAFARLREPDKEILLLAVGEGLDAPQVAVALGIGADAARQRLHRARAALSAAMEKRNHARRKAEP
jgi:RNA polymerase sigma-70 factor (ECF subfamily)